MVKGTSRQVIVVHAPEEKLFDQAIFLLRDGAVGEGGISDEALLREASGYLRPQGRPGPVWLRTGPLWGIAGAVLAWLVTILL